MSNRLINVLASIMVIFLAWLFSQTIPVNRQAGCSVSSRAPSDPNDDDPSAAVDDDSEDASDHFVSRPGTLKWTPVSDAVLLSRGDQTIIRHLLRPTSATLESQHTLLRL